jgi:flavin reductase (DIM6/NTAB) family NADH-FMN oxidoreductase RutF
MVEASQLEKMNATANELPSEQSEAETFKIETTKIEGYPPMVVDSPVVYFCELSDEIRLKNDTTVPVILNIKEIYLDDKRVIDREALSVEFSPLAHISGAEYTILGERVFAK